jgi:hypothetical protein
MEFKLRIKPGTDFSEVRTEYDPKLDNMMSIFDSVCDALHESKTAKFTVSGFGLDKWPVSVRTDLSILLEQLAEAIAAVKAHAPFVIDFYEQGIQRKIAFEPLGAGYVAQCTRCTSQTNWMVESTTERVTTAVLLRMFCKIRDDFMSCLRSEAPAVAAHPWLIEYFSEAADSSASKYRKFGSFGNSVILL